MLEFLSSYLKIAKEREQFVPVHLNRLTQNVHHLGSTSHNSQSWYGPVKQEQD